MSNTNTTGGQPIPGSGAAAGATSTSARFAAILKGSVGDKFPIPKPYAMDADYLKFANTNGLNVGVPSITAYAMLCATEYLTKGTQVPDGVTIGTSKVAFAAGQLPPNAPISESLFDVLADLMENSAVKAAIYCMDLAGSYQVSALDDRNVESYFKSKGTEFNIAVVLKILPYVSSQFPTMTTDKDFIARVQMYDWTKYHTTYASGNALVLMVLNATGVTPTNGGPYQVLAPTHQLVLDAVAAPWDKSKSDAIPLVLKGICHVHLEALGMLPTSTWYQGVKGRSLLSPAAIKAIQAYAVRSTALQADVGTIQNATTLVAAANALVATGSVPSV